MNTELQQGIAAVKAGNKQLALDMLMRATQSPDAAEMAWLWMSSVVNDDAERLYCIERVLRLNPQNANAQKGSAVLRQKGIQPAMPAFQIVEPGTARQPQKSAWNNPSSPNPSSNESYSSLIYNQQPTADPYNKQAYPEVDRQRNPEPDNRRSQQDYSSFFEFAVVEIANGKPQRDVEKLLIQRGVPANDAKKLAAEGKTIVKKSRRQKHQKRISTGCIMVVVGIAITALTYIFADELGGKFVLFYGLVAYGGFNLIIGMIGWVANL